MIYWDEWRMEIFRFFHPLFTHHLSIYAWIAMENEHRVFPNRVWDAAFVKLNGYWDNRALDVCSLLLYFTIAGMVVYGFEQSGGRRWRLLYFPVVLIPIMSSPVLWENAIQPFTQYHFFIIFNLAALFLLLHEDNKRYVVPGAIYCFIAIITMGSSLLTPLCAAIALGMIYVRTRNSRMSKWIVLAALTVFGVLMNVRLTPDTYSPYAHPFLFDHRTGIRLSASTIIDGLRLSLDWPSAKGWFTAGIAVTTYVCFTTAYMRGLVPDKPINRTLIALGPWSFIQALSVALARSDVLASRYLDIYTIEVFTCVAALIQMFRVSVFGSRICVALAGILYIALVMHPLQFQSKQVPGVLARKVATMSRFTQRCRLYLSNHDRAFIVRTGTATSYGLPDRFGVVVMDMLDQPDIRKMLPDSLESRKTHGPITDLSYVLLANVAAFQIVGSLLLRVVCCWEILAILNDTKWVKEILLRRYQHVEQFLAR